MLQRRDRVTRKLSRSGYIKPVEDCNEIMIPHFAVHCRIFNDSTQFAGAPNESKPRE
jgi:hypothetical protein